MVDKVRDRNSPYGLTTTFQMFSIRSFSQIKCTMPVESSKATAQKTSNYPNEKVHLFDHLSVPTNKS